MIKDDKGQVSIEFLLLVGAIITMVLVTMPIIFRNTEMNKALTAARDGGTKGAAMRGLGFSEGGGNAGGVITIINMTPIYQDNSTYPGNDWYLLRFYANVPDEMNVNSVCGTIETQARSFMRYAYTGAYDTSVGAVNGAKYTFTVGCMDVN